MAAPVWQSETGSVGDTAGPHVVPSPSGLASGNLVLVHVAVEGGTNVTISTTLATEIRIDNNSSNVGHYIGRIVYNGVSLGTFSLNTAAKWVCSVERITGQHGTAGSIVNDHDGANGASGNPDPPSSTSTVADCLSVIFAANKKAGTGTQPSGYTERSDRANSAGGVPWSWVGTKTLGAAAAENPAVITSSDQAEWVAATVLIAPPAGGGTPGTLTAGTATATAAAEAVTLDAASTLTAGTASATAAAGATALAGQGALTVTPASATAAADGAFIAGAVFASDTATATAQAEAVVLRGAIPATMAIDPATATADAGAVLLKTNVVVGNARIANPGVWAARACPTVPDSDALYLCTPNTSTGKLSMGKSTDGITFVEQDAANAPTNFLPTHPYSVSDRVVGDLIGVGYFSASTTARVRRFDTSTDTWETTDVGNADAATSVVNSATIRVVLRSDGDVLLFHYSGTTLTCARYEGSSWASTVIAALAGWMLDAVIDGDDRTWISYFDSGGVDIREKSLDAANSVGGGTLFDASAHASNVKSVIGTFYNEGTNNRVSFMGRDSTGEIDLFGGITGGTTLTSGTVNTFMTTTTPQLTSSSVIFVGVGSAGRLHICWATANAIQRDLSNQATPALTFNTDITVLSGLTDDDPASQWIQGLGGHGILYQDAGDVRVEWIVRPTTSIPATMTVTTATATAQAEAVALTGQGALAVTAATATGDAAGSLTAASVFAVTPATATAQAEAVVLGAATAGTLTVSPATATASPCAVAVAGQARLAVTAATATSQAEAITFDAASVFTAGTAAASAASGAVGLAGQARLALAVATATANAETVGLSGAGRLAVTPPTATASAEGVALDAASRMVLSAALATAEAGAVGLNGGTSIAGTLTVTPATASAAAGSALTAASVFGAGTATANSAADVAFRAASTFAVSPATANAAALSTALFGAAAFTVDSATAAAAAADAALRVAAGLAVQAATASAQAGAVLMRGDVIITHVFAAPRPLHTFTAAQPVPAFSTTRPTQTFDAPRPGAEEE